MRDIYFFIGTEAELIKVFPVMKEAQDLGKICHLIASGQNDILKSRILHNVPLNGRCLELSSEKNIKKTAVGLLQWFFKTKRCAIKEIVNAFGIDNLVGATMVVHGDTVSTVMGAMIGKRLGCNVCHVEAGLRSHNWFNPFPEEIDRMIVSKIAKKHFAPGDEPTKNLLKVNGEVINTTYNTILDSLRISKTFELIDSEVRLLQEKKYFVFVMHRQENIANKTFFKQVVEEIINISDDIHCVVILHKITEIALEELGIKEKLNSSDNFTLLPRVDYFDFMKLLSNSQFVITDGGSNQEELHYMGKPCLIMRKTTERNEGIGSNAMLYDGDIDTIKTFVSNYECRIGEEFEQFSVSPSKIIAERL